MSSAFLTRAKTLLAVRDHSPLRYKERKRDKEKEREKENRDRRCQKPFPFPFFTPSAHHVLARCSQEDGLGIIAEVTIDFLGFSFPFRTLYIRNENKYELRNNQE